MPCGSSGFDLPLVPGAGLLRLLKSKTRRSRTFSEESAAPLSVRSVMKRSTVVGACSRAMIRALLSGGGGAAAPDVGPEGDALVEVTLAKVLDEVFCGRATIDRDVRAARRTLNSV